MPLGSRFAGAGFAASGQQAAAQVFQEFSPLGAQLTARAGVGSEPILQAPADRGKRQTQGRDAFVQCGRELGGADEVVGEQSCQPFFAGHVGGFDFQLDQIHLGFEVAQVQFDMPAQAVEPHQFFQGVIGSMGQGGKEKQLERAEALARYLNGQQSTGDRSGITTGLELVVTGGGPANLVLPGPERAAQQFASAAVGEAKQDMLVRLAGGLDHAEDSEISVADEQTSAGGTQQDLAGQDLLADLAGAHRAI